MKKIRISSVSYLNSLPFVYGLEKSNISLKIELTKDIPSECWEKLSKNKVDIGLIPVAMIPKLPFSDIVSSYCIGATKNVRSVILASNSPIEKIKTIHTDTHSRTSIALAKILSKYYWEINPKWKEGKTGFEKKLEKETAGVVIGDKVFEIEKRYKYITDLATEWNRFTNLPFVFAAWVANKKIDPLFLNQFNKAIKFGIENTLNVYDAYPYASILNKEQVNKYLTENISFNLDNLKRKGLNLFLSYLKQFNA